MTPGEQHSESPLPAGWVKDFLGRADLEHSFRALDRSPHFYAEMFRGRIRSLQLRLSESAEHFRNTQRLAKSAPQNIPNLIRQFVSHVYELENLLLTERVDPALRPAELLLPNIPKALLDDYKEIRLVLEMRLAVEGIIRLHVGENEKAIEAFERLVEDNRQGPTEFLAMLHLGLVAAYHNLALIEPRDRHLDAAGLCIQAAEQTLNRVRYASTLSAFWTYIGEREEAASWHAFADRVECPESTKETFRGHGQLLVERSTAQSQLLLL